MKCPAHGVGSLKDRWIGEEAICQVPMMQDSEYTTLVLIVHPEAITHILPMPSEAPAAVGNGRFVFHPSSSVRRREHAVRASRAFPIRQYLIK
jgi:hypothetical protein